MQEELRADRTALAGVENLSEKDRKQRNQDAESLDKQMAMLLDVFVPLRSELSKAKNDIRRYEELADQYRQSARELRGEDEAGAAGAD